MKIILDESWSIEGIPYNYVLKQKRISNGTGKNKGTTRIVDDEIGYYCSVQDALKGYVKRMGKSRTEDFEGSIEDYCKRIDNIMDTAVEKMIARVKEWESGQDT